MSEQQGGSRRKPKKTDDRENFNEDLLCGNAHEWKHKHCATSITRVIHHNKNAGMRKEMTFTVSHAHVIHGTCGRKGERMSSVTNRGYFRRPGCICEDL